MTINIDNDAYLIIVYGDKIDEIAVADYNVSVKDKLSGTIENNVSSKKDSTLGKKLTNLITAGITSNIAQNMASKSGLSNAILGRATSSIYDIVSDGKVEKEEVAYDFINSFTNELDATAIGMGFPTVSGLYDAIMPNGSGVIAQDFLNMFGKKSEEKKEEWVSKRNKLSSDLTVLKFKLVTGDSESWSSELPSHRTEKGFDIVSAVQNNNQTKEFQIAIVDNEFKGIYMYDVKDTLESIREKKIPFDIYVNDSDLNKQYSWVHCLFSDINWEPNGKNCLNASLSITKIPEFSIQSVQLTGISSSGGSSNKIKKATGSKKKFNKTSKPIKNNSKNKALTYSEKDVVNSWKNSAQLRYDTTLKNTNNKNTAKKVYDNYVNNTVLPDLKNKRIYNSKASLGFK